MVVEVVAEELDAGNGAGCGVGGREVPREEDCVREPESVSGARGAQGRGRTKGDVAHVLGLGEAGDVADLARRFTVGVEDLRRSLDRRSPSSIDEFL